MAITPINKNQPEKESSVSFTPQQLEQLKEILNVRPNEQTDQSSFFRRRNSERWGKAARLPNRQQTEGTEYDYIEAYDILILVPKIIPTS